MDRLIKVSADYSSHQRSQNVLQALVGGRIMYERRHVDADERPIVNLD